MIGIDEGERKDRVYGRVHNYSCIRVMVIHIQSSPVLTPVVITGYFGLLELVQGL